MIQCIIKIYNDKLSLLGLIDFGGDCCVAAVAYLACEDRVLGHGCVRWCFILVSVVKRSFRDCWFWYLHVLGVRS